MIKPEKLIEVALPREDINRVAASGPKFRLEDLLQRASVG